MATYEEQAISSESDAGLQSINKGVSLNTYLSYSFINNSLFYPLLPSHLLDYYNRFIRRYFYWFDGFDPMFHTQQSGIFSTRIAYTLIKNLSRRVVGTDVMFDEQQEGKKKLTNLEGYNDLTPIQFVEKWASDVNLPAKLNMTVSYMFAGGDSVIKLNGSKKVPYPTVLRKDNYFISSDFSGKINKFTGLIYSYTDSHTDSGDKRDESLYYYLVEEREFDENDNPQYRIFAKQGKGNVTHAKTIDLRQVQEVEWKRLPKKFKKAIKKDYPNIEIGEWSKLPFEDSLGVYLYKNTDNVSFIPQLNMGESLLSNMISYLMSYDYYFSALNTDLYNGRGRVMMPKSMQNPESRSLSSHYSYLQDGYYTEIDYLDPEKQKPTPIQFDLRGNDWQTISKILLRGMAMSIGISERTITQSLTEGSEKATAREISVDDATATFITEKRSFLANPTNQMIKDILSYYDYDGEITVRFSRVGLTNMNETVTQMTTLRQNGLVDLKTALEYLYPDKNDKQLEIMVDKIKKEKEENINIDINKNNKDPNKDPQDEVGTSDEGYERQNNTDINHIEKDME